MWLDDGDDVIVSFALKPCISRNINDYDSLL